MIRSFGVGCPPLLPSMLKLYKIESDYSEDALAKAPEINLMSWMRKHRNHRFNVRAWALVSLLIVIGSPCLAQQPTILRRIEFVGLRKMTVPQAVEASGL